MPATTRLLQKAIQFSKAGRKEDARRLLIGILHIEPTNEAAWFWYVDTFEDRAGRIAALESFLKAVPNNSTARSALNKLLSETAQQNQTESLPTVSTTQPQKIHKTSKVSNIPLFLVSLGIMIISIACAWYAIQAHAVVQQRYQVVADQRDAMQRDLTTLQSQYIALQQELFGVRTNFENLNTQFIQLDLDYSNLRNQYDKLNQEYITLNDAYQQLSETYNQLSIDYADLEEKSIQPPYIFIHDRIVEMSFYRTDGTIWGWNITFEGLEGSIQRGYETREDIPIEYVVTDQGVKLPLRNFTIFVDSDPFTNVISTLYQDSASPDAFIREIWHIVTQLSKWTEEEGEIPRYPLETLLAGGGDCEDLSILFASLIRAAPVDWKIDLVYIDTDNLTNPQKHNHVIVHLNTGERDYFIETTNDKDMEPYRNGISGWYREVK